VPTSNGNNTVSSREVDLEIMLALRRRYYSVGTTSTKKETRISSNPAVEDQERMFYSETSARH
jgi:hypothetical protein